MTEVHVADARRIQERLSTCARASLVRWSDEASGSCSATYKYPWSSSGRNDVGSCRPRKKAPTAISTRKIRATRSLRISTPENADVAVGARAKTRLNQPKKAPSGPCDSLLAAEAERTARG